MNLRTLVEKAPMSRKMISFAAQRLMELKVESQSGAAYGEKNPERLAQRNGYAAFGSFIVRISGLTAIRTRVQRCRSRYVG